MNDAPSNDHWEFSVEQLDAATVVRIPTHILEKTTDPSVRTKLLTQGQQLFMGIIKQPGRPHIILDCDPALKINSCLLGMFVQFHKTIEFNGGKLYLTGFSHAMAGVFVVTQLDKMLNIADSVDAVIQSLAQ